MTALVTGIDAVAAPLAPWGRAEVHKSAPVAGGAPLPAPSVSSSYCGSWLRGPAWCLDLSRSQQERLSIASLSAALGAVCLPSAGLGCLAAGAVVAAGVQQQVEHAGLCPEGTVLEVEYAPTPGRTGCSEGVTGGRRALAGVRPA